MNEPKRKIKYSIDPNALSWANGKQAKKIKNKKFLDIKIGIYFRSFEIW